MAQIVSDYDRVLIDRLRDADIAYQRGVAMRSEQGSWDPNQEEAIRSSWAGLTPAQAFKAAQDMGLYNNSFGDTQLDPDSPYVQQFQQQFGQREWRDAQGNLIEIPDSSNATANGVYRIGYGEGPYYDSLTGSALMQDPSRVLKLPDGRYIWEAGNLNTDEIVGAQRAQETQTRKMRQRAGLMAAGVLGGGLAYNALGAGALGGGGVDLGAFGGLAPEEAMGLTAGDMVGGASGLGSAAGLATDIAPGYLSESVAPQVTEAMAGSPFAGNSLWQSALNYASQNPISAARGVAGLLGAVGSAGGSESTGGGSSGFQGGPAPSFDPVGNAGQFQQSQYQPMQFDPVPFMGGSMYYNQQQPNFMGQSWGGFNPNAMSFGGGYQPAQYQGGGFPAQSYQMGGYGMGQSGQPFMSNPFGMGQQQPQQPKPYMPPQFNMSQQPSQGLLGGQPDGFGPADPSQNKYGRLGTENQMAQNAMAPNMTNREFMGYARYLPGSKSPLDPNFSQNLLAKSGGNWQSMVPQRAQAGFQQFMNTIGNPQSFSDYQNWMRNY